MQGQIKNHVLWRYLNYQLSLFTLLAGPMPRYQDFEASWTNCCRALATGTIS